jgi:PIN domain nuclease of toxin-antitoxin system
MQALLLDTHVLLWLIGNHRERMTARAWQEIEVRAERNGLAISDVTFWELALKIARNHLAVSPDPHTWLKQVAKTPGLGIIQLDRDVLIRSTQLDLPTRDPADRMLVATALKYDLALATADRRLLEFAERHPGLTAFDVTALP